ncbi:hypothetical protein [Sphingomonas sp. URHD0057]|uniref:hypothetical protein n=1 Tax=Sphingomonas sp. URHD0057 TaxID=1380389 RepID=UPI000491202E|nr:hypothetical protein [Sphingomonas sp. URHD0057]
MSRRLAMAAMGLLATATGSQAQMRPIGANDVAHVAVARTLDLRLAESSEAPRTEPLVRGMLIGRRVAANATLGLGLANMYRKKTPSEWRAGDTRPTPSRKPAVTFVLKF